MINIHISNWIFKSFFVLIVVKYCSKKHPNFFINMGNASSLELEILGEDVKNKVKDKTGIKLFWEIERVGNFEKF